GELLRSGRLRALHRGPEVAIGQGDLKLVVVLDDDLSDAALLDRVLELGHVPLGGGLLARKRAEDDHRNREDDQQIDKSVPKTGGIHAGYSYKTNGAFTPEGGHPAVQTPRSAKRRNVSSLCYVDARSDGHRFAHPFAFPFQSGLYLIRGSEQTHPDTPAPFLICFSCSAGSARQRHDHGRPQRDEAKHGDGCQYAENQSVHVKTGYPVLHDGLVIPSIRIVRIVCFIRFVVVVNGGLARSI